MVDEARDVAADGRVDDRPVGQLEAPDVATPDVSPFPLQAFAVRNLLARVVDDPLVLRDSCGGKYAPSMNLRSPFLNHLIKISRCGSAGRWPGATGVGLKGYVAMAAGPYRMALF